MKTIHILLVNEHVLGEGAFLEHEESIEWEGNMIFPKNTIQGYQLLDVEVEDDFNWENKKYVNGVFVPFTSIRTKEELQIAADTVQANIDVIEKNTILNRGSRELELLTMEKIIAPQIAALNHVTVQQVLDTSIYYQKLKALDTKVSNLRAEMASLWVLINS